MSGRAASDERPALPDLAVWAMLAGLVHYTVLQVLALVKTGGVFEYPLDDVYIHLEMARSITQGGYGVNPGEFASAASSPIYPVFLTVLAGSELHRFVPALINVLALAGCGWAWGRLIGLSEFGRFPRVGAAIAVLGPVALNMAGVAFLGMEHSLHALTGLMVLLGLVVLVREHRVGWLLSLGIVAGPLLRPEGLAISVAACAYLFVRGSRRAGLALFLAWAIPVAAFVGFLSVLGIGPLPNSVVAKLPSLDVEGLSRQQAATFSVLLNLNAPMGKVMLVTVLAMALGLVAAGSEVRRCVSPLVLIAMAVTLAHLVFGQMGWGYRYEHYVLVFLIGAAIFAYADWTLAGKDRLPVLAPVLPLVALSAPLAHYFPNVISEAPASARAVYLQHRQMSRFAKDFVQAPVVVNDIGWVAYRNSNYVVDIWGLASRTALEARRGEGKDGWGDAIAQRHSADLAMIYDYWLGDAVGPDWVLLGELRLEGEPGFVAEGTVAFYATRPAVADDLRAKLTDFVTTVPAGSEFIFAKAQG